MVKTHKASANISTERGAINIARFFIASKVIGKAVVSKVIVGLISQARILLATLLRLSLK